MFTSRTAHRTAPTGRRIRRARTITRLRRGRQLIVGTVIAAAIPLALPANAVAETFPQVDNAFQVPSLVAGVCAQDQVFLPRLVPVKATTYEAGSVTFRFLLPSIKAGTYQATGEMTVAWLNLTTLQSGVTSAPFRSDLNDYPYYTNPGNLTGAAIPVHTGSGQVVAVALPTGSASPKYESPLPPEPCYFTPSIGIFTAP